MTHREPTEPTTGPDWAQIVRDLEGDQRDQVREALTEALVALLRWLVAGPLPHGRKAQRALCVRVLALHYLVDAQGTMSQTARQIGVTPRTLNYAVRHAADRWGLTVPTGHRDATKTRPETCPHCGARKKPND